MPFTKEEKSRKKAEEFRQQLEEQDGDENNNEEENEHCRPCCAPSGCSEGDGVNILDPDDVQKVVCNNPECTNGKGSYMHKICFEMWEEEVLTYLRSSGRARSWSEKQRKQNLWTKKGYDLAWKACSCKCGKGHLRKDLEWLPPKPLVGDQRKNRRRRKSSDKPNIGRSNSVTNGIGNGVGNGSNGSNGVTGHTHSITHSSNANGHGNVKGRKRHTSTSSTESKEGHSPPVSPGGHQSMLQLSPRSSISLQSSPSSCNNGSNSSMTPAGIIQEQQRERVRHASGGRSKGRQSNGDTNNSYGSTGNRSPPHSDMGDKQKGTVSTKFQKDHGKHNHSGQNHDNYFVNLSNINTWNGVNDAGYPNLPPTTPTNSMGNPQQSASGNGKNRFTGFLPRLDLSTFFQVLPAHKLNAYHIQMEEDNQPDSEEIRSFIFSTLSAHGVQTVRCSQCTHTLPVFDCYPLIDGTFYLTPVRYGDAILRINIPNSNPSRGPQYLAAVCMQCLEGVQRIVCRICKSRWDGSHHQLGTLYSYDIFAASPCCPGRAGCKRCGKPVLDLTKGMHFFSEFSRSIRCPHCGIPDFHCVKPLSSYEVHSNSQINVH